MPPAPIGELGLIEHIRQRSTRASPALRLGIGDDCAILQPPPGHEILVTTDFSIEGTHFRRDWHTPQSAGHRCLARGLSDLAAMGATPLAAFLSLALPRQLRSTAAGRKWLTGFLDGLLQLADATRTPLAGGDTSTAPASSILADIVLVGSAPRGKALRRSGAKSGDILYVTGALGGAAAELETLAARPRSFRTAKPGGNHPQLFPAPRIAIGRTLLRRNIATAAIDLSDGLSTDLHHLCRQSGAGAVLDAAAIPLHPLTAAHPNPLHLALNGGEDYELLFTARPGTRLPRDLAGVAVTAIGKITTSKRVLLDRDGKLHDLPAAGWQHHL